MKLKINTGLWLGSLFTGIILLVALIGPLVAPYSLQDHVKPGFITNIHGEQEYISPPIKPSSEHWFGTDRYGYDMFTYMLYGAKYTILAVLAIALVRVTIGTALGLIMGYYRKGSGGRVSTHGGLLSGIPLFIIAFFITYGISINSSLSLVYLTLIQCLVLIILGIPTIVTSIQNKTYEIKKQQYILSSISLGASDGRVIYRHIVPQMKEALLILLVNEMIGTLTLLGQLGIFHVFLGGTLMTMDPRLFSSMTHEWAGMAGSAKDVLGAYNWILFYPLGGYVALILGFYFLSKGLEKRYRDKYQKFIQL